MRTLNSLAGIAFITMSAQAFALEYTSVKQLMVRAIDAPDGKARGYILGSIADKFKKTTGSSGRVSAEVSTIKSFNREGCKRLNVRLTQSEVPTSDGQTADFSIDYGLNMCRDGSPPTEGMDLEQTSPILEGIGRSRQ
jgi:hypothetical protein